MIEPTGVEPRFKVFDVVTSLLVGEVGELGIVDQVQRYEDGTYRYGVVGIDESAEIGGIYNEQQLKATGQTSNVQHFWRGAIRARDVVRIAQTHPKETLRGRYAEVTDEVSADKRYAVTYPVHRKHGFGVKLKFRDVSARHLEPTGRRMPPKPVPRPSTTWTHYDDPQNLLPWHEYDILDEVEQYL